MDALINWCLANGWVSYSGTYSESTPYVLQNATGEVVLIDPNLTVNTIGNLEFQYIGTTPNYFKPRAMINIEWVLSEQVDQLNIFIDNCEESESGGATYPPVGYP